MSTVSIEPEATNNYADEKEKAVSNFLANLSKLGRAFWQYTEDTGESSTKSFDGWL